MAPVVRGRRYVDALRGRGFDPARRGLSTWGALFVRPVLGAPEHVRYLGQVGLGENGFSNMDEAGEAAIDAFDAHVRASGALSVESQPIPSATWAARRTWPSPSPPATPS